jgi:hypothetical protein
VQFLCDLHKNSDTGLIISCMLHSLVCSVVNVSYTICPILPAYCQFLCLLSVFWCLLLHKERGMYMIPFFFNLIYSISMHEVIIYSKPTNALCVIKCILLHVASHQHVLVVLVTIIHHIYILVFFEMPG